jgi:hypothetical protein
MAIFGTFPEGLQCQLAAHVFGHVSAQSPHPPCFTSVVSTCVRRLSYQRIEAVWRTPVAVALVHLAQQERAASIARHSAVPADERRINQIGSSNRHRGSTGRARNISILSRSFFPGRRQKSRSPIGCIHPGKGPTGPAVRVPYSRPVLAQFVSSLPAVRVLSSPESF